MDLFKHAFGHGVVPALFGAGTVLCGVHGFRAVWGYPKAILNACGTGTDPLEHSKLYYRSPLSLIPTLVAILGFATGAGLAEYSRPALELSGFGWVPPILAGLSVALALILSMKLEPGLIRRFMRIRGWIGDERVAAKH